MGEGTVFSFFEYLHGHRHDIRPLVGHEIGVRHNMYHILQIAFGNIGQSLIPFPEDQYPEPLDEEADACDDPIYPRDDADENPIQDTDQ